MSRVGRIIDLASDNWILPLITILLTLMIVGPGIYFFPGLIAILIGLRLVQWVVLVQGVRWIKASQLIANLTKILLRVSVISKFVVSSKGKTMDLRTYITWHQPLWTQPIAITSFFILIWLMFGSWQASLIFLLSMFAHEVGHAVVFLRSGIECKIRFLTLLGAVAYPATKELEKKSDKLPWFTQAILMLAGPAVNVFLMLIGHWFATVGIFSEQVLLGLSLKEWSEQIVYINGLLAIFNLVPMGKLDAGQFFLLVFSSLEEKWDYLIFGVIAAIVVSVPVVIWVLDGPTRLILMMIRHFPVTLFCYTMLPGLWRIMRSDNDSHHTSPQSMNVVQMMTTSLMWIVMVILVLQMF